MISYGKLSDASSGFRSDGIPNMFASFCLLFRLWRSVKEFGRLSGVFRCHSGLLFLQSCRKNVHPQTFPAAEIFIINDFTFARREVWKRPLSLERRRPIWGQITLNTAEIHSATGSQTREKEAFWTHFTVTTFDNAAYLNCQDAALWQRRVLARLLKEQKLGPRWAFPFLVDTFSLLLSRKSSSWATKTIWNITVSLAFCCPRCSSPTIKVLMRQNYMNLTRVSRCRGDAEINAVFVCVL